MGRPKEFDSNRAVEIAMVLFWRHGYRGTTPQALADAIGISKSSLYNAFGSKRQLFELALDRYLTQQKSAVSALLNPEGSVRDCLRVALGIAAETNPPGDRPGGCLVTNSAIELGCEDEAVRDAVKALHAHTEAALETLLSHGRSEGELRADLDPIAAASMLLSAIAGLQVLAQVGSDESRLNRVVEATLSLL